MDARDRNNSGRGVALKGKSPRGICAASSKAELTQRLLGGGRLFMFPQFPALFPIIVAFQTTPPSESAASVAVSTPVTVQSGDYFGFI